MIPNIEESEIMQMPLEALYSTFRLICDTEEISDEDILIEKNIKNGIMIKVPIEYILKGWYDERPTYKKVMIKHFGKCDLISFEEEIKKRETLMREFILRWTKQEDPEQTR